MAGLFDNQDAAQQPPQPTVTPSPAPWGRENLMMNMLRGIGFDGGLPSVLGDFLRYFDPSGMMNPMGRLHQYRTSPEYVGNKPAGSSMAETERLRGRTAPTPPPGLYPMPWDQP